MAPDENGPVEPAELDPTGAASSEKPADSPADASADVPVTPPMAAEAVEKEPQLELTVDRACNNPNGRYVGLSATQRTSLHVEVGGTVELFEGAVSIGLFTVGKGAAELTRTPGRFTANEVDPGKVVTVKKANDRAESVMKLPVRYGVERIPFGMDEDAALEAAKKIARRIVIITERFPDTDPESFMTLPTAVLNQMTGEAARVAAITKGKVRIGGKELQVVIVPTGEVIGFTTKAAKALNIPDGLTELRFRIDKGVLVVD